MTGNAMICALLVIVCWTASYMATADIGIVAGIVAAVLVIALAIIVRGGAR